jgi:hypothetical protein
MKTLAIALLVCSACYGQTLSEGSVFNVACVQNPDGTTTVEWFVGGGIPSGKGGFIGNGFGYADGKFNAFYQPPQEFGRPAVSMTATIDAMVYLPPIDPDFSEIAFTLSDIHLTGCGPETSFKQGRYYQGIYAEGNVQGEGPGGVVLEQ